MSLPFGSSLHITPTARVHPMYVPMSQSKPLPLLASGKPLLPPLLPADNYPWKRPVRSALTPYTAARPPAIETRLIACEKALEGVREMHAWLYNINAPEPKRAGEVLMLQATAMALNKPADPPKKHTGDVLLSLNPQVFADPEADTERRLSTCEMQIADVTSSLAVVDSAVGALANNTPRHPQITDGTSASTDEVRELKESLAAIKEGHAYEIAELRAKIDALQMGQPVVPATFSAEPAFIGHQRSNMVMMATAPEAAKELYTEPATPRESSIKKYDEEWNETNEEEEGVMSPRTKLAEGKMLTKSEMEMLKEAEAKEVVEEEVPLPKVIHAAPKMKEGACTFQISIEGGSGEEQIVVLDKKSLKKPFLHSVIVPWLLAMWKATGDDKYHPSPQMSVESLRVSETTLNMESSKPGTGARAPAQTFVATSRKVYVTLKSGVSSTASPPPSPLKHASRKDPKPKREVAKRRKGEEAKKNKPPPGLRLRGKRDLTNEQEEYLGDYRIVRKKHEGIKWQHTRYPHLFIARAPTGKWYAQERRHLGQARGQIQLVDTACEWPHESDGMWRSSDGKGGWYDQPEMRCKALPAWKMILQFS